MATSTTYQLYIPASAYSEKGVSSDGTATFKVVTNVTTSVSGDTITANVTQNMYVSRTLYSTVNRGGYGYINSYYGDTQVNSHSFSNYNGTINSSSGNTIITTTSWSYSFLSKDSANITVQARFYCDNNYLCFTLPDTGNYSSQRTVTGSKTVALFDNNISHLLYNPNGGTLSSSTYDLYDGTIRRISSLTRYFDPIMYNTLSNPYNATTFGLARTSYSFKNWNTASDGTGTSFDQNTDYYATDYKSNISTTTGGYVTLYAQWEEAYGVCGAPTNVTVSQSNGTATISWSGASSGTSNTISSYYIQYRTSSSGSWINLKSVTSTATSGSTTTSINSITTGYYQVRVQTRGSAGSSYYSSYKSSEPLASATKVSAPTNVTLSQNNNVLNITWTGASNGTSNSIVGYIIESKTQENGSYSNLKSIDSTSTSGSTQSYTNSNITDYYRVRIKTKGSQGSNYYSNYTESNTLTVATECVSPTTFTVTPSLTTGALTLNWSGATGGTNNSIVSYFIQYRTSTNATTWGSWKNLTTINTTQSSSSYSYTDSSANGTYIQYQIQTRGSQGSIYYSAYKTSFNYTRINTPPGTISSIVSSKSTYEYGDYISLNWSEPSDIDGNISHYEVYYLKEEDTNPTYLTDSASTSYTFMPKQVENQQRIQYGVRAVDELGEYSPSIKYTSFITRDDETGIKICVDGEYKKAYIYVCQNGIYKFAEVYICDNGSYSQAID